MDLWHEDKEEALEVNQNLANWEKFNQFYQGLADEIVFFITLLESGELLDEADLAQKYDELKKQVEAEEWLLWLDGEYDKENALFSIHAGTGGTDAQDWADILFRMYMRFFEKQGWTVTVLNKQLGNEAGLKRVELSVRGLNVYGLLKSEHGIHRLVRISPFDAEAMRHTSFASVEVEPELPVLALKDFSIPEEEIKVEVFRAGGHGGQGVNTTDSAVRLVHLPTKISVLCQNERSQMQNRASAEKILKSRVFYHHQQAEAAAKAETRGESKQASWGNQIRSYVMHPYQQIKDHRTDFLEKDIQKVLDGDLFEFIKAYLKYLKF